VQELFFCFDECNYAVGEILGEFLVEENGGKELTEAPSEEMMGTVMDLVMSLAMVKFLCPALSALGVDVCMDWVM